MTPDEIEKDRAAGAWCIVTRFFTRVWCDITHGGGRIERDSHGRINWRCARCGRWSDHPVPLKDERATVDREIQASISSRRRNNPMIKMPERIVAWPSDAGPMTGEWSANTYSNDLAEAYVRENRSGETMADTEQLAKWAYTFIMAERWKTGSDKVHWDALRPENCQFWLDEANRILPTLILTAERERKLVEALKKAARALDWAARQMKGNCTGSAVNATMLAAGNATAVREELGYE